MTDELRFLIVDPLPGVQSFARQLLESFGFQAASIRCASDPAAALAQTQQGFAPDFLITDWFAGAAMDGLQLHQQLCAAKAGCRLALLSFKVTPEHEAQAEQAGARFLLRKPFTADELKQTLNQALDRLAQERPDLHQRFSRVVSNKVLASAGAPPPAVTLPRFDSLRPGDRVLHAGKPDVVKSVVFSRDELMVQLKSSGTIVPASKLQRGP